MGSITCPHCQNVRDESVALTAEPIVCPNCDGAIGPRPPRQRPSNPMTYGSRGFSDRCFQRGVVPISPIESDTTARRRPSRCPRRRYDSKQR
jgi:hypothetical protein